MAPAPGSKGKHYALVVTREFSMRYERCISFGLLASLVARTVHGEALGLSIALHAQSMSSLHGWVAGSEVTTRGLRSALLQRADVAKVQIFAPFVYRGLADNKWDLLLIEGYSGSASQAARAVRRGNARAIVLHWCLDTYPNFAAVAAMPVDGFITNSRFLASYGFVVASQRLALQDFSPWYELADRFTRRTFIPLGVDGSEMLRPPGGSREQTVVYLGQPSWTKRLLASSLQAISKVARLEIYGSAWDKFGDEDATYAELVACCWKGKLPTDEISLLYARAAVVIGTTETAQRRLGMVNNRVFEAVVASGGSVVLVEERLDDHFEELRRIVADLPHVHVVHSPENAVTAVLKALHMKPSVDHDIIEAFVDAHSYVRRADQIVHFARDLQQRSQRRVERVVVAYDASINDDWEWISAYLPALARLERFDFELVDASQPVTDTWCAGAALIIARGTRAMALTLLVDDASMCAAFAGGQGLYRPPPKMLVSTAMETCEALPYFDVILIYRGESLNCSHPNVHTVAGIDVDALRPSTEQSIRTGVITIESTERRWRADDARLLESLHTGKAEALINVLKTVERLDISVPSGGLFFLLAGLAAGAVVQVPDGNIQLGSALSNASTGHSHILS